MAKGSQLSQLKSALSQAGLNRQPPPGKKRKRTLSTTEREKEKKAQKLQEIKQKLNPFDVKVTKLKHDVGGRKLKGVSGKPQESKQAGLEKRKRTLLKEYSTKDHAGGIIDRRFGESDPTMTPEERMLERFTKERQRASRGVAFNLEDEDELTHYGQSLSKLDDFDDAGLGLDDEDEEDGKIDSQTVKRTHFGGFSEEDDKAAEDEETPRKKSKAEVMSEIIEKSKQHKVERQIQRQQDADVRHELDEQLGDIRQLLFGASSADPVSDKLAKDHQTEDRGYDQNVRELALDKRAKPKDRTKTEEELALEAKETLERAERKRQKRMRGEADDSSDDERGPGRRPSKRDRGGDDLEDDFADDDEEFHGLGAGLEEEGFVEEHTEEDFAVVDSDSDEDEKLGEESEDESHSEDDEVNGRDEQDNSSDASSEVSNSGQTAEGSKMKLKSKELPYTFPCPESHEDFLSIVEDIDAEQVPTVVQRIRTLHHASLAVENKFKLQALTGVLIDYILHVTSPPEPNFRLLPPLLQHIHALTASYPIESANYFKTKLSLMQKNLQKGFLRGATSMEAKTWPGTSELALLWLISHVWPTSDMEHPVVSPARLLIGSYLGLGRVRKLQDISSGLFLCTLFLRYEEYSKRLVPEVVTVILNAILHLSPHRFENKNAIPGNFPCPDFNTERCRQLKLNKKTSAALEPGHPNLIETMDVKAENAEKAKVDLLAASLDLLNRTADMYKSLDGFVELFEPASEVLVNLQLEWASAALRAKHQNALDILNRLLKFAKAGRRPLALQAHKPIPIATYIPKFDVSSSSYLGRDDPDRERAAASKLRYQYKQERKGAIRELRKDARFMSAVKQKEQQEKDKAYADRMNKVYSSMESERAEQKKMDREKQKEKKRAGRK